MAEAPDVPPLEGGSMEATSSSGQVATARYGPSAQGSLAQLIEDTLRQEAVLGATERRRWLRAQRELLVWVRDVRMSVHQGRTMDIGRHGASVYLPQAADLIPGDRVELLLRWADCSDADASDDPALMRREAMVMRATLCSVPADGEDGLVLGLHWSKPVDVSNLL